MPAGAAYLNEGAGRGGAGWVPPNPSRRADPPLGAERASRPALRARAPDLGRREGDAGRPWRSFRSLGRTALPNFFGCPSPKEKKKRIVIATTKMAGRLCHPFCDLKEKTLCVEVSLTR